MSQKQPAYTPPTPSFLSRNIFFPLYDRAVLYFPRWWTPNAITLFGIACTATASLLLLVTSRSASFAMSPAAQGNAFLTVLPFATRVAATGGNSSSSAEFIPSMVIPDGVTAALVPVLALFGCPMLSNTALRGLVLFLAGLLNLLYTFADNTDGRHARNTKQSSYTGEYLDHGLDCVTSLASTFLLMAVLGIPLVTCGVALLMVAIVTNLGHIVNHEQGIMIWGNDYFSVDEAMLLFGFGMWVPIVFPQVPTLTIPSVAVEAIPLLAGVEVRYIDVILCCLLVGQIDIMWTLMKRDRSIWLRPTSLAMLANAVVMFLALSRQLPVAADAPCCWWGQLLATFSYPALWVIMAACTSSLICHIPIVAKCLGSNSLKCHCDFTPLGAALVLWLVFWSHPRLGAGLAVAVHAAQVLFNLDRITRKKQPKLA